MTISLDNGINISVALSADETRVLLADTLQPFSHSSFYVFRGVNSINDVD